MSDDIVTRLRQMQNMQPIREENIVNPGDAADEIERLRTAIDSLLQEVDSAHVKDGDFALCVTCGVGDGSWPCVHRMALDDLKDAVRGE